MGAASDLLGLSIGAAARLLRDGGTSAAELAALSGDRIRRLNPALNAFLSVRPAAAGQAEEADRALAQGAARSPLAGIPLAHKDMFDRAGETTTFGAHAAFWKRPESTSAVKARLDDCLAVDMGTLNMSEFAAGPTGENSHHGRCANPWAADRLSGGSSSGSAAAVAARMIHGSIGSDTGGSIRVPAALCGITGLKPTYGRVSRHGAMARVWSQDSIGPLARSAEDCALILQAVAGPDDRDPLSALTAPPFELRLGDDRPLRLSLPNALVSEADDDVAACFDAALKALAAAGVGIDAAHWPDVDDIHALAETAHKAESTALHDGQLTAHLEKYGVFVRQRFEEGALIPAVRYLQAQSLRPVMVERFLRDVMRSCDAVVLPTVACVAPVARALEDDIGANRQLLGRLTRYTRPFNYLGLPALTVPCGFGRDGLPVGLQIVGRPFDEATILRVGHLFQTLTDWHHRSPDLSWARPGARTETAA